MHDGEQVVDPVRAGRVRHDYIVDHGISPEKSEHRHIIANCLLITLVVESVQMCQEKQATHDEAEDEQNEH